jgi:SNF2 family DNA or RNA helicase
MHEKYIQILEMAGIPESALENSFSQAAIKRGIDYFESNRAEITHIESTTGQDIKIYANVFGSKGFAYDIIVTLKVTPQYISIIGECDCPVGFRCKHAVATVLQFAHASAQMITPDGELSEADKKKIAEQEVVLWLNDVVRQSGAGLQHNTAQQAVHNNILLYLLRPDENDTGMEVVSISCRRLKKGGYGKAKQQSLEELVDGYSMHINYEYTELDGEIAGLLYSMAGHGLIYRQNVYPLKGDIGELTLEKLLQTGRCFWLTQEDALPLKKGEERSLHIAWEHEDEHYFIFATVTPGAQEMFQLKHFFYLDSENHLVGRIQHPGYSREQVQKMLLAPPIPESIAQKVSQELIETWPGSDLPTPVTDVYETVNINQQPTASVLLHSVEYNGQVMHVLSLRFAYGEHLIQPDEKAGSYGFIEDSKRYIVKRDLTAEQHFIDVLLGLNAKTAVNIDPQVFSQLSFIFSPQSQADSVWLWHDFQHLHIPQLQQQGWTFNYDDSFFLEFSEADSWYGELEEEQSSDWFEMSLGIEQNGKKINLLPSLVKLLSEEQEPQKLREIIQSRDSVLLPVDSDANQQWIKLPAERILGIFDTLVELYDSDALNKAGKLVVNKQQSLQFGELFNDRAMHWKGADELQKLTRKLENFTGIAVIDVPDSLQTELRDYQHHGLNWLQFLRAYQFNGILADDMGLGKTVQTLTHLLYEKQRCINAGETHRPSLVIAPTSLMGNWRREAKRFTPDLTVLTLHGAKREIHFENIMEADLVLTTYALILRDKEIHQEHDYHYLILDESQNIKNARSKTAQLIFQLKSKHRLCLTGTPMENHLGELWSLFHFLMPGYLGSLERFNRLFRTPIEKKSDQERQLQLHKRIKPFMLRRTKSMVAKELPEKTDMIRSIPLSGKQRDLYETVRLAMDEKVRNEISKKGLARSQIMILDALLKLRQVCCDPRLLSLSAAKEVTQSAKLEMLMDMLPEMVEEGRKILVFSQFVSMLNLIEQELKAFNVPYTKLTGQTRKRDEAIHAFQEGEVPVFLISLKAGGVGLNLTAADTVIHYDPWWNPAVEKQATDRAYRIGQEKPVFVYKLLTEDTVEEKILSMQQAKQKLADGLYEHQSGADNSKQHLEQADGGPQFSQQELLDLLKPVS